ncbi:MAG: hypothetical protein PVI89_14160 [Desulfobacteraceae bacterium]|jgi:hypothetical protein
MIQRIRNYVLIALAAGAFYFLLSHHIIFTSYRDFNLLKKSELSLKYTFFSMKQQSPERILRIKELRDAGIEDYLLDKGMVSEEKLNRILDDIYAQEYEQ